MEGVGAHPVPCGGLWRWLWMIFAPGIDCKVCLICSENCELEQRSSVLDCVSMQAPAQGLLQNCSGPFAV